MQVDWLWGQWMIGFYVDSGQVHICLGPVSFHKRRQKHKKVEE